VRRGGDPAATAVAADWDGKFAAPVAAHLVSRPRLHARLTAGLQFSCTLIAAPAGWGKTLLAGSWLAEGGAGRAAAWISLAPEEDDVRALWTAIATAIAPVIGEQAAADLRHVAADEAVETVPGRVAAILAGDGTPVVLVLDNLHEITSLAVHESLLRLARAHLWAGRTAGLNQADHRAVGLAVLDAAHDAARPLGAITRRIARGGPATRQQRYTFPSPD
jgi:hypothetical protein